MKARQENDLDMHVSVSGTAAAKGKALLCTPFQNCDCNVRERLAHHS